VLPLPRDLSCVMNCRNDDFALIFARRHNHLDPVLTGFASLTSQARHKIKTGPVLLRLEVVGISGLLVEQRRVELLASALRTRRSALFVN